MLVFLRLVEDVLILQTVPVQRRRDMLQALTSLMPRLFPCFVRTLNSSFESLLKNRETATMSSRLILTVLELLTLLADWVHMNLLIDQNGYFLQLLCHIISEANNLTVQLAATDCLLVITSRKVRIIEWLSVVWFRICLHMFRICFIQLLRSSKISILKLNVSSSSTGKFQNV